MTREQASKFCRDELNRNGLHHWHIRLTTSLQGNFLGMCSYKDECLILSAHHIDIHPDEEIINTIRHEIAHALTPGHRHDEVWASKAREIGCDNVAPCSNLSFTPDIIDAIRSGADVKIEFDEEVIRRPKYTVTRLQDKCEVCHKVAVTANETFIEIKDVTKPDVKIIKLTCGHMIIREIPKGTLFQTLQSDDGKTPYKFQINGMRFIESALASYKGAIVADEMGLGKTIQVLGYIKFHPEQGPFLIIVKSALKFQWFKEILRWCGVEYLAQVLDTSNEFVVPGLKCYIISYDLLIPKVRQTKTKTINQGFDITKLDFIKTVILDECQQIKNPDSSRTQQVRRIVKDKKVIGLSGTPWKNRGSEYFSILNMVHPTKFSSYAQFVHNWVDIYFDGNKSKQGGIRNIKMFKEYTQDFVIRREISDAEVDMPDVNRTVFNSELNNIEQRTYDDEESEFVKWYNQFIIDGTEDKVNGMQIIAKLARMRHITGLAKIPATMEFVDEFIEDTNRKLCIFVHHKDVGDILYRELKAKYGNDMPVVKITGEMNSYDRTESQDTFNNSPRALLIASTLAAGEGLNLQTCSDAIMHERQWNPQNEDQAAPGRFRRIGSTAKVINVIFTIADGTVDSILHNIVETKRGHFHNTMNRGELNAWNENSIVREMATTIVERWKAKNKNKPIPKYVESMQVTQ